MMVGGGSEATYLALMGLERDAYRGNPRYSFFLN